MKAILLFIFISLLCFPSYGQAEIVDYKDIYTYDSLTEDLSKLKQTYPKLISYKALTTTPYGRKIWAVKVGNGDRTILLNGAHHAREWMTSTLLMKMIETYAEAYRTNQEIDGFHPSILNDVAIWFVPMVNPDGVTLQQFGLDAYPKIVHRRLVKMNKGSKDFKRWKANIRGIDLNRQYPANWDKLKGVSEKPSYQFYKGKKPLQAIEVKALIHFTNKIKPEIAVSYHSSGNMIFWGFHRWGLTHTTDFTDDYYTIAEKVAEMTNYSLEEPSSKQQGGGYTDWFITEFDKPAFTVEIGSLIEESSLPLKEFPSIWERNKTIGLFLSGYVRKHGDEFTASF